MICLINESGKERVCWALGVRQCQVPSDCTGTPSAQVLVPPAGPLVPFRRVYGASAITCCIKTCSGSRVHSGSFSVFTGSFPQERWLATGCCPEGLPRWSHLRGALVRIVNKSVTLGAGGRCRQPLTLSSRRPGFNAALPWLVSDYGRCE